MQIHVNSEHPAPNPLSDKQVSINGLGAILMLHFLDIPALHNTWGPHIARWASSYMAKAAKPITMIQDMA